MKAICFRCEQPLAIGSMTCGNCGLEINGQTLTSQEAKAVPPSSSPKASKSLKTMAMSIAVVLFIVGCFFAGNYAAKRTTPKATGSKTQPIVISAKVPLSTV